MNECIRLPIRPVVRFRNRADFFFLSDRHQGQPSPKIWVPGVLTRKTKTVKTDTGISASNAYRNVKALTALSCANATGFRFTIVTDLGVAVTLADFFLQLETGPALGRGKLGIHLWPSHKGHGL